MHNNQIVYKYMQLFCQQKNVKKKNKEFKYMLFWHAKMGIDFFKIALKSF